MRLAELAGRRVALLGYGREIRSLLRLLLARAAPRELVLFARREELEAEPPPVPAEAVAELPPAERLRGFEVLLKSPGISAYRPELEAARAAGVRIASATALWFAEHGGERVIAVTGTKGKSTTVSLIAHLLRALGRRVALAGNIGLPLTELWRPEPAPDWWVLELSSFQTRDATPVAVAVLTALFPEHLDWHGCVERYYADKLALVEGAARVAVNGRDPEIARRVARADALRYGVAPQWRPETEGLARGDRRFAIPGFAVPGAHNRLNLCAALAALELAGEDPERALPELPRFRPLPHRLRLLGERGGIRFVDDSIATTPQASLAALDCFPGERVALILGGFERGLDWRPFAAAVQGRSECAFVCQGMNGARIAAVLRAAAVAGEVVEAADLAAAVTLATRFAAPDGVVLLSPGAPSFPSFRDYAERGRAFAALAGLDPDTSESGGVTLGIAP